MSKTILNRGFTLIEVMVVVVILGILAALDKLDNYVYPTTDQGLEALVTKTTMPPEPRQWKEGGYLDSVPIDPWEFPYNYLSPGVHGEFDLYSLGADGQTDGTSVNADIGNWQLK